MPTTDLISPFVVSCAGGLTLNKDVFSMAPGEALILQNFEPDIKGGYRRVDGTALYNTNIVPQGSSNTSKVIDCSIIFNNHLNKIITLNIKTTTSAYFSRECIYQ